MDGAPGVPPARGRSHAGHVTLREPPQGDGATGQSWTGRLRTQTEHTASAVPCRMVHT